MTSYLRSWLYSGTSTAQPSELSVPTVQTISPQASDDEDGDTTETERDDDDSPPAFPALNSAQRAQSSRLPSVLTDAQLMPPPPLPSLAVRQPGVPNTKGNSLALPPTTTKAPLKPSKKREKVALAPGFGPLDWAALKSSGADLRVRISSEPVVRCMTDISLAGSRYPNAHTSVCSQATQQT